MSSWTFRLERHVKISPIRASHDAVMGPNLEDALFMKSLLQPQTTWWSVILLVAPLTQYQSDMLGNTYINGV